MGNEIRFPRQSRGIQTREKLIVAALELFSEKGYHSTNSKEIAARCGVAIGSFYAYFKDKKELFIEAYKYYSGVIDREFSSHVDSLDHDITTEQWNDVWKNFPPDSSERDKIRIILTNLMTSHHLYPGFPREITVMRLLDPDIKKVIDDHEINDIRNLAEFIKSIKGESRIKNIDTAADIIYRTLELIIHETMTRRNSAGDLDRIIEEMTDMIYRYLFG